MRWTHLVLAAALAPGCVVVHVSEPGQVDRVFTDVEMMRQAVAEIRILATAFEAFAVDQNLYPVPATVRGDERRVADLPFWDVHELSEILKIYSRSLPKRDPWGTPYLFWSDGKHYMLICLGADREIARMDLMEEVVREVTREEDLPHISSYCIEDEIFLADGIFVLSPRDPMQRCVLDGNTRRSIH